MLLVDIGVWGRYGQFEGFNGSPAFTRKPQIASLRFHLTIRVNTKIHPGGRPEAKGHPGRTYPASSLPTSISAVPELTAGSPLASARILLFVVGLDYAESP